MTLECRHRASTATVRVVQRKGASLSLSLSLSHCLALSLVAYARALAYNGRDCFAVLVGLRYARQECVVNNVAATRYCGGELGQLIHHRAPGDEAL
jgi:hypothetical protein